MKRCSRLVLKVGASCGISLAAGASHADTVLQGWQAFASVESDDPDFGRRTTRDFRSGFGGDPLTLSLHADRGGGHCDSLITFDQTGVHSSWDNVMDPGHENAETRTAYIFEFEVLHDSTYSLSGFYNALGTTRMAAMIYLSDRQSGIRLFEQVIDGKTIDPSLTIGQDPSWSSEHVLAGSTTGTLLAGRRYRIDVDVLLSPPLAEDQPGATGAGSVNLDIVCIPVPASLALLPCAAALRARRRRRV